MIFVLIAVAGLVLMGLSTGFFLAVSIGIQRQDRFSGYRALRDEDEHSRLSRTGSRVVGLKYYGPASEEPDGSDDTDEHGTARTPTAF